MTRMLAISLVTLGDPSTLTGGYLYHQRLAELAPAHDARIDFISFLERPFPLPALGGAAVLERSARAAPNALVIDSIAAGYLAPWLLSRTPGVPVIAMLHQPTGGIDHGPLRTRLQAALDRAAYNQARCLLVASDSLAAGMRREGFEGPIVVVPPGRDPAATTGAVPYDLRRGTRAAFLSIGNWVERKGLLELLDAFAHLPPGAGCLHLVGDRAVQPRYAARVAARLARPDLAGKVIVHGRVSRQSVAALYSAADVFVLPSLREPYGTVYGEAMAGGLPVVGWRAGNLPYLATHEREGLLVPPGDVKGLSAALERLSRDEALRLRLGEAARRRASSLPTWEQTAEAFFGAVREAIAR